MKRILIIAAPFGFGPASKALILAEYLRDRYRVSVSSMHSAIDFLCENAPEGVDITPGLFRKVFPTRESLSGFHAYIAINQVPALQHLAILGLAGRSVFIDSLSQWRAESEPEALPDNLLAHVVQDEFSESGSGRINHPERAVVTAPLLWPDKATLPQEVRRNVLLHTGGMTSPTAGIDLVNIITDSLIKPIVTSIVRRGHEVTLLGNADVFRRLPGTLGARILGSVSPAAALKAIGEAKLLITTPGIGAIYEAMSKRTPLVLLPPTNSSQLRHYRVLTRRGIIGVLDDRSRDVLMGRLAALPWPQQTPALLKILAQNASRIARTASSVLAPILESAGTPDFERHLATMAILWSSLSHVSPQNVVLGALDQLG